LLLPAFAPETAAALADILPGFATVANPLDVTGYVLVDRTLLGRAMEIVAADPGLDAVLLLSEVPRAHPGLGYPQGGRPGLGYPQGGQPADPDVTRALYAATARRIAAAPRPVIVVSNALTDITGYGREFQASTRYPSVVGGIEHGMQAIGAAVRWSQARRDSGGRGDASTRSRQTRRRRRADQTSHAAVRADRVGVWTEDRAAALLAEYLVPVVPTRSAADPAAAVAAAESLGYPVVLKAVSAGVAHKSDIGAVRLALPDADAVRRAFRDVNAAARAASATPSPASAGPASAGPAGPISAGFGSAGASPARILVRPRILVQPYRSGGVELVAGIVRDPAWGLVLAVGLGGIWVEALRDTALRVLPVSADDVRGALGDLRGAAVLRGARGTEPADLGRVADVIARIAAVATDLGDRLESLEVNPLFVRGSQVEALDALITWRS
jgi:acyl-CoA synthetase (NDP forming)